MHDSTLSLNIQTTSARLMLNLVKLYIPSSLPYLNLIYYLTFMWRNLSTMLESRFWYNFMLVQVEPIFEKGVDQQLMDEARILLV